MLFNFVRLSRGIDYQNKRENFKYQEQKIDYTNIGYIQQSSL